MRRLPLLLAALAVLTLTGVGLALGTLSGSAPALALSAAAGQPGSTTTVTGRGFPGRAPGSVTLGGTSVPVTADADGRFAVELEVDGPVGPLPVAAALGGRTATASFTVQPDTQRLAFGVSTPGGLRAAAELDAVAAQAGEQPALVLSYLDFTQDLDTAGVRAVLARGATPLLTWEPWVAGQGADQQRFSLRSLAAGEHDTYLTRFGRALAAVDAPVLLRFAHEMNGDWYPWSERRGGAPGDYAAAWRHVHRVVTAAGASRVQWVWAPNVPGDDTQDLAGLWPGAEHVDVVGLDGYNWGGTPRSRHGWQSPREVFGAGLEAVRAVAPGLPVMVTETASAEEGGDKAAWSAGLVRYLDAQPDVTALVWFDHAKEEDWRIASSPASAAGLREALARRAPGTG